MSEKESPYKRVSLEEVSASLLLEDLSALDRPWRSERARFDTTLRLAYGLLTLFGLAIVGSGVAITVLAVTFATSGAASGDISTAVDQVLRFVTSLLPYIGTPLGLALGYFFRGGDSRSADSQLDRSWELERARLEITRRIAYGLVGLFGVAVILSVVFVGVAAVGFTIPGTASQDAEVAISQIVEFVTVLLPYVATPLGVTLGSLLRVPYDE